jgi:hypothetical protein
MRERRPGGDDICDTGHRYPSAKALDIPQAAFVSAERKALAALKLVTDAINIMEDGPDESDKQQAGRLLAQGIKLTRELKSAGLL